jgi:hypothetical protein
MNIQAHHIDFQATEAVRDRLKAVCAANRKIANFVELGCSAAGRPVDAVVFGTGPQTVSLMAGAHSDEPVGPETLRLFVSTILDQPDNFKDLLSRYKFVVFPHINPDGEAHNQGWIRQWPDFPAYLRHAYRELPGRDVEFGFPAMRPENRLVSGCLRQHSPYALHISLHGMGIADGAMLLIEKHWISRTVELRRDYAAALQTAGLPLHDHDRKGEKGFAYIGPGFSTTPEGSAMRAHFESLGDPETAALFCDSSMEFVRSLGNDPLCLVTELPLFIIKKKRAAKPGIPATHLEVRKKLPQMRSKLAKGESVDEFVAAYQIESMPAELLLNLQLRAIALGLVAVASQP